MDEVEGVAETAVAIDWPALVTPVVPSSRGWTMTVRASGSGVGCR